MDFKRRVTPAQLAELTPKQQERLREWWKPTIGDMFIYELKEMESKSILITAIETSWLIVLEGNQKNNSLPLLDIGQMMEILMQYNFNEYPELNPFIHILNIKENVKLTFIDSSQDSDYHEQLCDCLWQAVKGVLTKEEV